MSKNFFKHLHTVDKHRFLVFKYSCIVGIPFQGLIHDLSKYSHLEFHNGTKYYNGKMSPLLNERKSNNMYALTCVHHTNRNKHHYEYWIDFYKGDVILKVMPYKYALEYVIDMISASKTYNGKSFNRSLPLQFFIEREKAYLMHPMIKEFVKTLLSSYEKDEFKYLKKKYTKKIYNDLLNKYPLTYKVPFYSINNNYEYIEIK